MHALFPYPTLADYAAFDRGPGFEQTRQPTVSIVIPVYNGARFLEESLRSALDQDYEHCEVIIVEGASSDRTMEIVDRFRNRIAYVLSEPDGGIYDAMNRGIALSRGDLIKVHASDDWMPAGSARAAANAYEAAGRGLVIVRSAMGCMDMAGRYLGTVENGGETFLENVAHPTWYVPKELYAAYGLYSTDFRIGADTELFLRLRRRGVRFCEADSVLCHFRSGGRSSGYANLREGFEIYSRYLGRRKAAAAWARGALLKAPRALLGESIEAPWIRSLRQKLPFRRAE